MGLPVNLDDIRLGIRRTSRNWLGKHDAFPSFVGRMTVKRSVWAMLVVLGLVMIKQTLQWANADRQNRDSQPVSEGLEQTLGLALDDGDYLCSSFAVTLSTN